MQKAENTDGRYQHNWYASKDRNYFYREKIINGELKTTIYIRGKRLGKGEFGEVYELIPNEQGKKAKVVKICAPSLYGKLTFSGANNNVQLEAQKAHELVDAIKITGLQLPHKAYFPKIIGSACSPEALVEAKYDGSLKDGSSLTTAEKKAACIQLISGLKTVHDRDKCIFDLHSENIFFRRNKKKEIRVDFADFSHVTNSTYKFLRISFNLKKFDIINLGLCLKYLHTGKKYRKEIMLPLAVIILVLRYFKINNAIKMQLTKKEMEKLSPEVSSVINGLIQGNLTLQEAQAILSFPNGECKEKVPK